MKEIDYEIIDHGCDGEQYFPGCGTAFTRFTDVATGIGNSAHEAAQDALEQMSMTVCGRGLEGEVSIPDALEREAGKLSKEPSFNPEEVNEEWHHYVSIRWRTKTT